jgi:hypothetical protein
MIRSALLLLLLAAPAFASKVVEGRITHAEDGSEAFKKSIGRTGYILRVNLATASGEVVIVNVVETVTRVTEGGAEAQLQALRAGRQLRAVMPDDCNVESDRCVPISVEVTASVTRLEAKRVQDEADKAVDALPPAPGEDPGMKAFGQQGGEGGREAAEDAQAREQFDTTFPCPEGMVPMMSGGKRVIDVDGKPACKVKRSFVKGELTNLGSDKLLLSDSRFGLRLGYARLDSSSYLHIEPEVDLHFGTNVALGLGVPLNVLAYAGGFYDKGVIKLRAHDYDKPSDYARVLRYFTIGRKEDNFYLNVSQLFAASIGHGAIVRRYSGNIDQNITRVGAQLDAYGRWGGFEAFVGDVVQPQHFVAGLAFLKPLGFLTGDLGSTLGQTSVGLASAADFQAPYTLNRIPILNYPKVRDDGEPDVAETRRAQIVGVDLETKVLKTEGADIKPYVDYSRLLDITAPSGVGARGQGGGGATLGVLGRFNAGEVKLHAFRVVLEGRYYDGNYVPGYFDTFYEVQKYQFITGKADTAYEPKLRTILARDPAHKRGGYYAEVAYQYNSGLAMMAAFEQSFHVAGPDDICPSCSPAAKAVGARNLTLHLEYPAYSWLQFFGSFYRRSFDGGTIDTSNPLGDNTLVYAALRLHILPILFLNARIYRSWQADPVLGEEKNVYGGDVDLEFGYEFDRSSRTTARR